METKSSDVIIVGSGPTGLIAALVAAKKHKVLLLEKPSKNPQLGKRILVSGNGRANFFNASLLEGNIPFSSSFLPNRKELSQEFLSYLKEEIGFTYITDEEGRMYPYFRRSECLQYPLIEKIKHHPNITVAYQEAVKVNQNTLLVKDEKGKETSLSFSFLVLALGGRSYDRKNYSSSLVNSLSLSSYPFQSALCPVRVKERIPSYLAKNRLKGDLRLYSQDQLLYEEKDGELLFKEDGISGICVFNSTIPLLNEKRKNPTAGFHYSFDYGAKDASLLTYPSFLRRYLQESHQEKGKPLSFTFLDTYGFEDSQISYGGVLLDNLNLEDFSLKKQRNIFLGGEMLDVNCPCGGYNMGLSFLEGYQIGKSLLCH